MTTLSTALATARIARGLNSKELAEMVGVRPEAISRFERATREPSPEVLAALASALGVTPSFLKDVDKVKGAWAIDAHLRRRATAPSGVWRRFEARLNMLRNHARYLYEEIEVRAEYLVPTFDPDFMDPTAAARMTRMQWRLPIGPVRSLTQWVEGAGCLIVEEDFGTDRVDGLSQWVNDHPVMLINGAAPTDRRRLTIAHELGHLCLHTPHISDDMETEANEFAAEFLMPAEVIKSQLRNVSLGRLLDLKRIWGVSIQALIERGYFLKTISRERRTSLYKQLSARGWRKQEPGSSDLAPESPQLARKIAADMAAYGLSAQEIAQFSGFAPNLVDNPDNPFRPDVPRLQIM